MSPINEMLRFRGGRVAVNFSEITFANGIQLVQSSVI